MRYALIYSEEEKMYAAIAPFEYYLTPVAQHLTMWRIPYFSMRFDERDCGLEEHGDCEIIEIDPSDSDNWSRGRECLL